MFITGPWLVVVIRFRKIVTIAQTCVKIKISMKKTLCMHILWYSGMHDNEWFWKYAMKLSYKQRRKFLLLCNHYVCIYVQNSFKKWSFVKQQGLLNTCSNQFVINPYKVFKTGCLRYTSTHTLMRLKSEKSLTWDHFLTSVNQDVKIQLQWKGTYFIGLVSLVYCVCVCGISCCTCNK